MPYIRKDDRRFYADEIDSLVATIDKLGELNYVITKLCHGYLDKIGHKYKSHAGIIGVLETLKLELYRRKTVPYENQKILENGDL